MCYLPTWPLLFLQKKTIRDHTFFTFFTGPTFTHPSSSHKTTMGHHSILSVLSPMDHFWRAFVFAFMTPMLQRWQLMPCALCLQYVADAKRIARSSFKTGVSTFHFFFYLQGGWMFHGMKFECTILTHWPTTQLQKRWLVRNRTT